MSSPFLTARRSRAKVGRQPTGGRSQEFRYVLLQPFAYTPSSGLLVNALDAGKSSRCSPISTIAYGSPGRAVLVAVPTRVRTPRAMFQDNKAPRLDESAITPYLRAPADFPWPTRPHPRLNNALPATSDPCLDAEGISSMSTRPSNPSSGERARVPQATASVLVLCAIFYDSRCTQYSFRSLRSPHLRERIAE